MAVFTGTATGHEDLLNKIVTHLTTGLGSQNWTLLRTDSSATSLTKYLQAPGLSGTDEIFVNCMAYKDVAEDIFNLAFYGASNYQSSATVPTEQPNSSPISNNLLWDSSTPYWLIANGRRFILVAKVSTTYQSAYCGLYLPYATSAEMPYPIAIMGSSGVNQRWSANNFSVSGFFDPVINSSYVRHIDGFWLTFGNISNNYYGFRSDVFDHNTWPFSRNWDFGRNQSGGYGLLPVVLHSNYSGGNVYGELEGVYKVSGYSLGAEDIITIDSVQYLVIQSVYRNENRDYAAIKLI